MSKDFPSSLLEGLDQSAFQALSRSTPELREHKLSYADVELWLARSWKAARRLGLDKSPPLDVLDIGIGPGYFFMCASSSVIAASASTGLATIRSGRRSVSGSACTMWSSTLSSRTSLFRKTLGTFDLVTAFRAQFNYNSRGEAALESRRVELLSRRSARPRFAARRRFALKLAKQEHKGHEGLKRGDASLVRSWPVAGRRTEGRYSFSRRCAEQQG